MKRFFLIFSLSICLWATGLMSMASACPMCKEANETENALPRAYMYSILFMIAMPATIFTGLGWKFYRLTQERDDELPEEESFGE
ncbi:hypothetical protein Pla110_46210 [Polystyrenella longa]|uniref:Uncharacterized protein n=1 Tax=Polystyrenella longa TaxID=2528007 RepID=A0A518CUH2_9PLAN|nr:hypothetical protein [Polystyrenella longa]QDU82858.1 hypothetical protein Pla110_46210 [Polystyrenella longa]